MNNTHVEDRVMESAGGDDMDVGGIAVRRLEPGSCVVGAGGVLEPDGMAEALSSALDRLVGVGPECDLATMGLAMWGQLMWSNRPPLTAVEASVVSFILGGRVRPSLSGLDLDPRVCLAMDLDYMATTGDHDMIFGWSDEECRALLGKVRAWTLLQGLSAAWSGMLCYHGDKKDSETFNVVA